MSAPLAWLERGTWARVLSGLRKGTSNGGGAGRAQEITPGTETAHRRAWALCVQPLQAPGHQTSGDRPRGRTQPQAARAPLGGGAWVAWTVFLAEGRAASCHGRGEIVL